MSTFSLDHGFASSRSHCQSILESCFEVDPGYLRPVLHSGATDVMSWFYKTSSDIESTLTAWVSRTDPSTGYIGLARSQPEPTEHGWSQLLNEAETWLRLRGVRKVFAPVDGATWFDYRLGMDGDTQFDWEPMVNQKLQAVLEARGYSASLSFHSTGFESQDFPRALKRLQPSFDAAQSAGLRMTSVQESQREDLLSIIFDITSEVYVGAPCFEPIDRRAFDELYRHYNARRNISFSQILRDPNGTIIGFLYAFEDRGLVVIKTIGILPSATRFFPSAKTSASQALLFSALGSAQSAGLTGGIAALIRDSASSRILEKTQVWAANWRHRYHLYDRQLA